MHIETFRHIRTLTVSQPSLCQSSQGQHRYRKFGGLSIPDIRRSPHEAKSQPEASVSNFDNCATYFRARRPTISLLGPGGKRGSTIPSQISIAFTWRDQKCPTSIIDVRRVSCARSYPARVDSRIRESPGAEGIRLANELPGVRCRRHGTPHWPTFIIKSHLLSPPSRPA